MAIDVWTGACELRLAEGEARHAGFGAVGWGLMAQGDSSWRKSGVARTQGGSEGRRTLSRMGASDGMETPGSEWHTGRSVVYYSKCVHSFSMSTT